MVINHLLNGMILQVGDPDHPLDLTGMNFQEEGVFEKIGGETFLGREFVNHKRSESFFGLEILYPKNHGISKLVVWRSQNPPIQGQTPS